MKVNQAENTKFQRLILLDQHLSWDKHVVNKTYSDLICITSNVWRSTETLKTIYFALINFHLSYRISNIQYEATSKGNLDWVLIQQKTLTVYDLYILIHM